LFTSEIFHPGATTLWKAESYSFVDIFLPLSNAGIRELHNECLAPAGDGDGLRQLRFENERREIGHEERPAVPPGGAFADDATEGVRPSDRLCGEDTVRYAGGAAGVVLNKFDHASQSLSTNTYRWWGSIGGRGCCI
jgi:hypothetical protein